MNEQVSTFYLNGIMYGLPASDVQEIVPKVPITEVPLAPEHVLGLINLRGQFATVVSLSKLFGLSESSGDMNVVCRNGDSVIAFSVDEVGDMLEIDRARLIPAPGTLPRTVSTFLDGVYRTDSVVYGIVSIAKVIDHLVAVGHSQAFAGNLANSFNHGTHARK